MAVVPSPGLRVAVAESLSRDLVKVKEWCDLWGIKLNASKTVKVEDISFIKNGNLHRT